MLKADWNLLCASEIAPGCYLILVHRHCYLNIFYDILNTANTLEYEEPFTSIMFVMRLHMILYLSMILKNLIKASYVRVLGLVR